MSATAYVPQAMRAGVEELFTIFAIFPEDAVVPTAAIDVPVPLLGDKGAKSTAAGRRQMRKSLQQLVRTAGSEPCCD